MKQELANIATNESHKLNGFKVLGFIPFHLKYITVKTHIQLCRIKDSIQGLKKEEDISLNDFHDADLQEKLVPLLIDYCVTGLLNDRSLAWWLTPFIRVKLKRCTHLQILNLYTTIFQLNQPAFFLGYWKSMMIKDHTILKEDEQSSDTSQPTKKKQA